MRLMRASLRIVAVVVAGMLAALVLIVAGGMAMVQTQGGREQLARALEGALSTPGGTEVRIEGIGAGLPARLSVAGVSVADGGGTWLEARDLRFTWRPWALLTGRLQIGELSLAELHLLRLPAATSSPEPEPESADAFELPDLPVSVRAERLQIATMRIDEAVAGQAMVMRLTGQLGSEDRRRVHSQLAIERQDGGTGALHLVADYDLATRQLALDARLEEAPGGLAVGLLGIVERPALTIDLSGGGPLAEWRGTLKANARDWARLDAGLALQRDDGLWRLGMEGSAAVTADPVPALRPLLAGGVTFAIGLRQKSDDVLAIETLALTGRGTRLSGTGTLDQEAATIEASLDAAVEPGALAPGVLDPASFERAQVHARIDGALSRPDVKASGVLEGIAATGTYVGRLEWQATAQLAPGSPAEDRKVFEAPAVAGPSLTATGKLVDLRVDQPVLQAALGDTAAWSLRSHVDEAAATVTVDRIELSGRALSLEGSGGLGLESRAVQAQAALAIPDLQAIASAAGSTARGSFQLGARVTGDLAKVAFQGDLQARLGQFATGIAAADTLLGQEPRLDGTFTYDQGAGLDVRRLQLAGRYLKGEGSATLSAGMTTFDARLRLEAPDLAPLSAAVGTDLRGAVAVDARASGNPADPTLTVAARLDNAVLAGVEVPRARADLRATEVASRATGKMLVEATSGLGPFSLSTDFRLDGADRLRLGALAANAFGIAIDGQLDATLDKGLATGSLHARAGSGSEVGVGDLAVGGPINLDVRLTPVAGKQNVGIDLRGGPLTIAERQAPIARIGSIEGSGTVADALGTPQIRANLKAADAAYGATHLAGLQAEVHGSLSRAQIGLAATGTGATPSTLDAGGVLALAPDETRFELQRLAGRLAGRAVILQRPAHFAYASKRMEVSDLEVSIGDGRLMADARVQPAETSASIRIEALPLAIGQALTPQAPAAGRLDLTLDLHPLGRETVGEAAVRVDDIAFGTGRNAPSIEARARAAWTAGRVAVDGNASGAGVSVSVAGALPLRLAPGSTDPVVERTAPLEGSLTLKGDVARLATLLALSDQRLEGSLGGTMTLGGSLAAPRIGGGFTVDDGLYENFVTGTLLNDVSIRLQALDQRTLALRLDAADGGTGHLQVEGQANFEADDRLRGQGTVEAHEATLIRRDDVIATTNARLDFSADGSATHLAGSIEPTEIDIRLLDRLPPTVAQLPVLEIGQRSGGGEGSGKAATKAADDAAGGDVMVTSLDIDIALPRRVFVRGRGLDSEWAGALKVGGTATAPRITGNVYLIRGIFGFAGKRFTLQRGTVSFEGGERIDPLINAMAEYRTADIIAQIAIIGLASHPEIKVTSQPPLPESEILAQVLFGKSSAKLGPIEAIQLAAAVESLARGESTSEDAFSFARTLLGLDTLTVQPSSATAQGSSLAVGSYVGDRVYIGAEQGIEQGGQAGSIEVEIAPGISIESEIGQDRENGTQGSLGLKWKLDY